MEFKLISLIALLLSLSLVSGRKYMNCEEQTDPQMKCVCYIRERTVFISSDCGANREIAKDAVNYVCRHNNNCKKGFIDRIKDCPNGLEGLCRYDCQASIFRYAFDNYNTNYSNNAFGVKVLPSILEAHELSLLSNAVGKDTHECASWRKEE